MEKKKILFISQEVTPYLPESEMSIKSRNLPQAIQERGREIRTFMPKFGCVNERRNQLHEVIRLSGMNLVINDTDHPLIIKVASIQAARMQVYFIDSEDYFKRKSILSDEESGLEFEDNDERASFFARGVLETVVKLRWAPDIIHCHGWMSSLVPLYIKKNYGEDPLFVNSKVIYSPYAEEFKSNLSAQAANSVLIPGVEAADVSLLEGSPSYEAFTKLGVEYADAVIKGSEKLHPEVDAYIAQANKLTLDYQAEETYVEAYDDFYNKVFEL
ncbi:MAG: glycogen/starch synthase [Mangrovibacterium sp.]